MMATKAKVYQPVGSEWSKKSEKTPTKQIHFLCTRNDGGNDCVQCSVSHARWTWATRSGQTDASNARSPARNYSCDAL